MFELRAQTYWKTSVNIDTGKPCKSCVKNCHSKFYLLIYFQYEQWTSCAMHHQLHKIITNSNRMQFYTSTYVAASSSSVDAQTKQMDNQESVETRVEVHRDSDDHIDRQTWVRGKT